MIPGQLTKGHVVLLIGFLYSLPAGIVVILRCPVPDPIGGAVAPQPDGAGVDGAVITAEVPLGKTCRQVLHNMGLRGEHGVDRPAGGAPFSQHEPPVEGAGIQSLVPPPDRRRQGGVIPHGEVEIKAVLFPCLLDPLPVEPVKGMLRIAAEPVPRARHRTAGQCLLHKGAGHQGDLIQQDPGQGDALDEGGAAFIPPAEEVKPVFAPAQPHRKHPPPGGKPAPVPHPPQNGEEGLQQVALEGEDGFAAEGKILAGKAVGRPHHEGEGKTQRFAAAHRPIAEDGVFLAVRGAGAPPGEHPQLFFAEGGKAHHLSSSSPAAAPAATASRKPKASC